MIRKGNIAIETHKKHCGAACRDGCLGITRPHWKPNFNCIKLAIKAGWVLESDKAARLMEKLCR